MNKMLLYPEDGVDPDLLRMFKHTVQNLGMLSKEVKDMCRSIPALHPTYGIPKCAISALKVHLAPALEPLSNLDFNMTERDYQDYQVNDVFVQNFMAQIRVLLKHIRGCELYLCILRTTTLCFCFCVPQYMKITDVMKNLIKYFRSSDTSYEDDEYFNNLTYFSDRCTGCSILCS